MIIIDHIRHILILELHIMVSMMYTGIGDNMIMLIIIV